MAMSLITELYEYWREFPPMHILLRRMSGYHPPEKLDVATNKPVISNANQKSLDRADQRQRAIFEALKAAPDPPRSNP